MAVRSISSARQKFHIINVFFLMYKMSYCEGQLFCGYFRDLDGNAKKPSSMEKPFESAG